LNFEPSESVRNLEEQIKDEADKLTGLNMVIVWKHAESAGFTILKSFKFATYNAPTVCFTFSRQICLS
jgi:hypothetical protein